MAIARHRAAVAAGGEGHFSHVQVASGVAADVMRCEKIAGGTRVPAAPPPRHELTAAIKHADPAAGRVLARRRGTGPHPGAEAKLRHIDAACRVDEYLAGPRYVGPLRNEFAFRA